MQLLASPLTRQRILALATGLEYATLPFMAVAPSGVHWSMGAAQIMEGQCLGREVLPTGVVWWWAYRPDGLFFRRGDHGVMPLHASIPAAWFPCGCIRHGYGLAHALLAGTVDARPLCRATLYFLNAYIGVVLPTLAACCYRWPPSEPMPTGSQEAPAASWRLRLAWLVRHCSALASRVDRWLVAVAGAHHSGIWRLFVLWHTAVVCWWVSRMAAGIV